VVTGVSDLHGQERDPDIATSIARRAPIAGSRYARKFLLDTGGLIAPTDENLATVLAGCAMRPFPEWYDSIRCALKELQNA